MRSEAIETLSAQNRIGWICGLLGVARSSFYKWRCRNGKNEKKDCEKTNLLLQLKAAHEASRGTYGSPRLHRSLKSQEIIVGRRRVERLMREAGLVGRSRRKFVKTTRVDEAVNPAENLLDRSFVTNGPNQKCAANITYLATKEGFVYLAAILDLFSNHVDGFALADHMRAELVLQALEMAV